MTTFCQRLSGSQNMAQNSDCPCSCILNHSQHFPNRFNLKETFPKKSSFFCPRAWAVRSTILESSWKDTGKNYQIHQRHRSFQQICFWKEPAWNKWTGKWTNELRYSMDNKMWISQSAICVCQNHLKEALLTSLLEVPSENPACSAARWPISLRSPNLSARITSVFRRDHPFLFARVSLSHLVWLAPSQEQMSWCHVIQHMGNGWFFKKHSESCPFRPFCVWIGIYIYICIYKLIFCGKTCQIWMVGRSDSISQ